MTLCLTGCQTTPRPQSSQADEVSALKAVTKGLTNKEMSDADLKNMAQKLQKDPEAQSAVRSINSAFKLEHTVKYCPETGERFSSDQEWCPDHKVKLEWVE
ncbi:MAG: hypothetical protein HQL13_06425, partial [Candidatus Omnitrophica bacterium]|nr:hypothetical protein [Candidatus Omnitrophota bacterium]